MAKNILLVLTGGTICSFADENGELASDAQKAQTLIVEKFRASGSSYADEKDTQFDVKKPLDILSENMTIAHWNHLIKEMKTYDFNKYDGVVILHGTDTLAYTSSLLSLLLAGVGVPVFLVASQLPLSEESANGNDNFKTAVELIVNGIKPNIYVAYRNKEINGNREEEKMFLHYGGHLMQCAIHSNNFYSIDMMEIKNTENPPDVKASPDSVSMLYDCSELSSCVLKIEPYVGLDYDRYSLKSVRAVIHGVYHSSTMAVEPYGEDPKSECIYGIETLKQMCEEHSPPVPLFIESCNKDAYNYETTGKVLRMGAVPLWKTTSEMAYVKLLVGCSNGLRDEELVKYVDSEVNHEFIYC